MKGDGPKKQGRERNYVKKYERKRKQEVSTVTISFDYLLSVEN